MTNITEPVHYVLTKNDLVAIKSADYLGLARRPERDADNYETGSGEMENVMLLSREVQYRRPDAGVVLARMQKLTTEFAGEGSAIWHAKANEYGVDFSRTIPLDLEFTRTTQYRGTDASTLDPITTNCYWGTRLSYGPPEVKSVLRLLRVGDGLAVHWVGTNNSPVTDEVGFVRDEVSLIIIRGGVPTFQFLLDVYCGKNNTARFVR